MSPLGPSAAGTDMNSSCPDCGTEVGFEERTARVRQGTCPGCGHRLTLLSDAEAPTDGGTPPTSSRSPGSEGGDGPEGPGAGGPKEGPACEQCGTSLELSTAEGSIEAHCRSCGTTLTYVLAPAPSEEDRPSFRPRGRPPRDEGGPGAPRRGRPCRECGGPLTFSTDRDGNVTGECASCGNRFTLPPRREGPGGRRFGAGGFRPGRGSYGPSREGGRWGRQGPRARPSRYRGRPPDRARTDEDDDDARPRRRRR